MLRCKISVIRKASYPDLSKQYENPISHTCDLYEGQVFWAAEDKCPRGFCKSAWESIRPFVLELLNGGGNFFDGWMKNPNSAMLSCNDGFRPVSFYVEAVEE